MIPLSQWLCGRHAHGAEGERRELLTEAAPVSTSGVPSPELLIEDAYDRGSHDGAAGMKASMEALRQEHSIALAQQEAALDAKWADHSAASLANAVTAAFLDLRRQLEDAICDVLKPFLAETVTARASAQLLDLLCEEVARTSDPILEIRSPVMLHEGLTRRLSESGIITTLSPSDAIEVVARDETSQFRSMASRWIDLIRTNDA